MKKSIIPLIFLTTLATIVLFFWKKNNRVSSKHFFPEEKWKTNEEVNLPIELSAPQKEYTIKLEIEYTNSFDSYNLHIDSLLKENEKEIRKASSDINLFDPYTGIPIGGKNFFGKRHIRIRKKIIKNITLQPNKKYILNVRNVMRGEVTEGLVAIKLILESKS